jgi:hypothetical protein
LTPLGYEIRYCIEADQGAWKPKIAGPERRNKWELWGSTAS